ncbi:amino acid ABC transporter permease [Brucella pseudogrignonensis]|uniref:amino acid ABC transporter permease n=1 Tax=Brucella pseudogrignonensis TaxID=419475 RepID=UPI003D96DE44
MYSKADTDNINPLSFTKTRLYRSLFGSPLNLVLTIGTAWVVWTVFSFVFQWAVISATWEGTAELCKQNGGACWVYVRVKLQQMFFGVYPSAELWRAFLVVGIFLALLLVSMFRRFWRPWLLWLWIASVPTLYILMAGGIFGMLYVPTSRWSGLPLTLILAIFGLALAFPFAVLLALARRSSMPVIRMLATIYIEFIRGVPLISLLFMASVLLPLFMPAGVTPDKLARAQVAIIMFAAAYIAEVIRGGLQAVENGQYEAAKALGLGYWRMMALVVLPQALSTSIPPLMNTFISFFKDTTLVVIVGLLDFLWAVRSPYADPVWGSFATESYVVAGVTYFVFCFSMSKYSQYLERTIRQKRYH